MTPYTYYVMMKHDNPRLLSDIVMKLREQGMGDYNLKESVYNGRFEKSESTPLMRASKYGCIPNMKMLFEQLNVITDITNKNDETCLYTAVRYKQLEAVKYICSKLIKPASPLEVDYECARNGLTPFGKAVTQNNFQIADVLL